MKCNCKEEWGKKCSYRSRFFVITNFYCYSHEFGVKREWFKYTYMYSPYINLKKNDEILMKYLMRKYHEKFCYLEIANWVVKKTKINNKIDDEEDLISCIMSYLYWSYGEPFNNNNLLKIQIDDEYMDSIMNDIINGRMKREERKRKTNIKIFKNKTIKAKVDIRITQSLFRKKLVNKYGCCQICGMDMVGLLRASHSKPFKNCTAKEAIDEYNGLLLCPNHDVVYDKGHISFSDDGSIILSEKLSEDNKKRLNLTNDIKIDLKPEHGKYLKYHREHVFKGNVKSGIGRV